MIKTVVKQYLNYIFLSGLLLLNTENILTAQIQESAGSVNGDVYGQVKVIGDIDGDGFKDLIFGATDGKVHIYSATGHEIFRPPYWPSQLDAPILNDIEIAVDPNGEATNVYATTMSGALFCLNTIGKTQWVNRDACDLNSGVDMDNKRTVTAPVLVPGSDGNNEVYFGAPNGFVYSVNGGVTTKTFDAGAGVEGAPVLVDLDRNGVIDLVTKNIHGKITAFDLNQGTEKEWESSNRTNSTIWPYPVDVRDINGDGVPEIFTTSPGSGSKFTLWSSTGKELEQFSLPFGAMGTPQVADMDGDGVDDFIIAGADGTVRICDKAGKCKEGWPKSGPYSIACSPQLVDLDGDGYPEIVYTGVKPDGTGEEAGCVIAYNRKGQMMDGFPKYVGKTYAKPTFADLDGDGSLEMIIAGGVGYTGKHIHIFRTDGKYNTKMAVLYQETKYK